MIGPLAAAAAAVAAGPPIDLAAGGSLQIIGAAPDDRASDEGIVAAGDVNGDGRPDLVVGARLADNNGRANSGSAYLVFGPGTTATLDLAALGSGGYRIDGAAAGDEAGESIAAAGDVNGDGRPDAIVGARFTDNNGRSNSGSAYVVFGRASTTTVDLAALGPGGFRIDGALAGDLAGASVAGVGDVNGDGLADVAVGSPDGERAHVVFGRASTTAVDLAGLGAGGYALVGPADDEAGQAVAGVGDVNGDGRPDVAVGDPSADVNGGASGTVFVTFGKASAAPLALETLGDSGFRIDGQRGGDRIGDDGLSVAAAGDVDADGRADLVIGAEAADPDGVGNAGSAWVVFSRPSGQSIHLGSLGGGGYRIDGPIDGAELGEAVAGLGDINGDEIPDLALGADGSDNNGRFDSGSVWVVLGTRAPAALRLGTPGGPGGRAYRIDGPAGADSLGDAVGGVADIDGDGRPEILAGSELADPAGRSAAGRGWAVSTGRALATATTGLASAVGSSSATLAGSVNPSGLATNNTVEFGPTAAYGSTTALTAAGSGTGAVSTGATLTGLAAATTYHYRQVAITAAGHRGYGADRTFTTTPDAVAPTPPAVAGGALAWRALAAIEFTAAGAADAGGSGLAGYEARTSRDGGRTWSEPTPGPTASASAEGETLVQFRARDGAGNASTWSPSHLDAPAAEGTARLDRTAPGAIPRLAGTTPARARPLLSWAPVVDAGGSGLAGYRVIRDAIVIATAAATEFVDPDPPGSGSLAYRIVAVDAAGNTGGSSPVHRVDRAAVEDGPAARPLAIAIVPRRLPVVAGRATLRLRCRAARGRCRGVLSLQGPVARARTSAGPITIARAGRRLRLGRRSFSVPAGRTRRLAVAILPAGLRAIGHTGTLPVRVIVVSRRTAGRPRQVQRTRTLLVLAPNRASG